MSQQVRVRSSVVGARRRSQPLLIIRQPNLGQGAPISARRIAEPAFGQLRVADGLRAAVSKASDFASLPDGRAPPGRGCWEIADEIR